MSVFLITDNCQLRVLAITVQLSVFVTAGNSTVNCVCWVLTVQLSVFLTVDKVPGVTVAVCSPYQRQLLVVSWVSDHKCLVSLTTDAVSCMSWFAE